MKASGKIHVTVWLLGLAGAALFTILLIRQGLPQVGAAFAAAGWAIAAVVAFHFAVPVFLVDALGGRIGQHTRAFRRSWRRHRACAVGGD